MEVNISLGQRPTLEAVQTLRSLEPSQMQLSPQMGNLIIITRSSCCSHDNHSSLISSSREDTVWLGHKEGSEKAAMLHSQHLQFDNATVPFILCSKYSLYAASWFVNG